MDNKSTAAFEAWHNDEFGWYNPNDIQWQKRLRTWNASRKEALGDAFEQAAMLCDLRANGDNDATWCAESIRSLK